MPNPQQPEVRRSERVPALDPDATEAVVTAERHEKGVAPAAPTDPDAPVPAEQRPGHDPERDQDKPPLDEVAERLGVPAEGDEPADAPSVTDTEPDEPLIITTMRKRRRAVVLALALPAAAVVAIRQVFRRR
jgi:hypothetical protein